MFFQHLVRLLEKKKKYLACQHIPKSLHPLTCIMYYSCINVFVLYSSLVSYTVDLQIKCIRYMLPIYHTYIYKFASRIIPCEK